MREHGFLHVIVHSGHGLPPSDYAIIAKPTSDPYCVVQLGTQSHRTPTVGKELSPTWEHHCHFRLAGAGKGFVRWASGTGGKIQSPPDKLEIAVYDEDTWTNDDFLGRASVDLRSVFDAPDRWLNKELQLTVAEKLTRGTHNTVSISLKWESAPPISSYALRVMGVICFAVSATMSFLAASCRWESAPGSDGAVKQPGVGAAMLLASIVLLMAMLIHLVLAHSRVGGLVELLEQLEMGPIPVDGNEVDTEATDIMKVFARPRTMANYEISIHPTADLSGINMPIMLVAWLLPIAGALLIALAMCLQALQASLLPIKAGQVLALIGILSVSLGYLCNLRAETDTESRSVSNPEDKPPSAPRNSHRIHVSASPDEADQRCGIPRRRFRDLFAKRPPVPVQESVDGQMASFLSH